MVTLYWTVTIYGMGPILWLLGHASCCHAWHLRRGYVCGRPSRGGSRRSRDHVPGRGIVVHMRVGRTGVRRRWRICRRAGICGAGGFALAGVVRRSRGLWSNLASGHVPPWWAVLGVAGAGAVGALAGDVLAAAESGAGGPAV